MNENCPHCGVYLIEIRTAPNVPGAVPRRGWRTIGHVVQGVYDGVLYWSCPDCRGYWHTWPKGDYRYASAEKHIKKDEGK